MKFLYHIVNNREMFYLSSVLIAKDFSLVKLSHGNVRNVTTGHFLI